MQDHAQAGEQDAGEAGPEIGRPLPARGKALGADLVGDDVQQDARSHRGRALEIGRVGSFGERGKVAREENAAQARARERDHAQRGRARPQELQEGQDDRRGQRGVVRDQRDLQFAPSLGCPQRRGQGEPLDDRVEEECHEPHLGGDALARQATARQEARPEDACGEFHDPGQREPRGDPEERRDAQSWQRLGQEMKRDHAAGRRKGKRPRQFEQRGPLPREQRERPAQERRARGEDGGDQHAQAFWQSAQRPRNSS